MSRKKTNPRMAFLLLEDAPETGTDTNETA